MRLKSLEQYIHQFKKGNKLKFSLWANSKMTSYMGGGGSGGGVGVGGGGWGVGGGGTLDKMCK
jgi:hypothetical protein